MSKFKLIVVILGIVVVAWSVALYFGLDTKHKITNIHVGAEPLADELSTVNEEIQNDTIISQEWLNLKFDSCVIYFCKDFYKQGVIIRLGDSEINKNINVLLEKEISYEEANEISKEVSEVPTEIEILDCLFQPHHGLVFYYKSKAVAQVSICLNCGQYRSTPESGMDWKLIKDIFKKYGLPSDRKEITRYYIDNDIEVNDSH